MAHTVYDVVLVIRKWFHEQTSHTQHDSMIRYYATTLIC